MVALDHGLGFCVIGANAIGGISCRRLASFVSFTTPITSSIVSGYFGSWRLRTRAPTGPRFAMKRRTNVSFTIATLPEVEVSKSLKSRPARTGIPRVLKYPGLRYVNFELLA